MPGCTESTASTSPSPSPSTQRSSEHPYQYGALFRDFDMQLRSFVPGLSRFPFLTAENPNPKPLPTPPLHPDAFQPNKPPQLHWMTAKWGSVLSCTKYSMLYIASLCVVLRVCSNCPTLSNNSCRKQWCSVM